MIIIIIIQCNSNNTNNNINKINYKNITFSMLPSIYKPTRITATTSTCIEKYFDKIMIPQFNQPY